MTLTRAPTPVNGCNITITFYTEDVEVYCHEKIFTHPSSYENGRTTFKGVLYFGLMLTLTDRRLLNTTHGSVIQKHR